MSYYLGIDAGGTKTIAVATDENGNVKCAVKGESINFNSVGMTVAKENMKCIYDRLVECTDKFEGIFVGLSALSDRADERLCLDFFENITECNNITMDSDLYICLESMLTDKACAAVISGTGSMVIGRTEDGRIIHKGGWGYILGDEGSGYSMCMDALKAAVRGFEGSGEKTLLSEKVCSHFNVDNVNALIDIFYDPPMTRSEIAGFMPRLMECARHGDDVASDIIKNHAAALSNTACALLREMPENTTLGLWGGIMIACDEFVREFTENVSRQFPKVKIEKLKYPPEIGAVIAAMKDDGLTITEDILVNLKKYNEPS